MKIFQKFEQMFAFVAVRAQPPKPQVKQEADANVTKSAEIQPFGLKQFALCIFFALGLVSTSSHLYFDARTFQECCESIYPVIATMKNLGVYVVLSCNAMRIFELINEFEKVIEMRMLFNLKDL